LGINKIGGGLTGGPGWINTVRYGDADLLPGQPNAAANAPAKAKQLYCLHVTFQKSMTGNVLFRQVTFRDHVLASFARSTRGTPCSRATILPGSDQGRGRHL